MKMKWCVLTGSAVLMLPMIVWAQIPLNSLVARVDTPRGPIPAECEQGMSVTPPLRVEVRELDIPEPELAEPMAPPSGALRSSLHEAQLALTRNDRPAFNAALARAKALLETYPTGGERRAAEDIVRLHNIAVRLWDAQYETPFFSDTDPEYALVRDLPGYAEAVRRHTLTDDRDRRFYPTVESREYVTDLAAERLQRLGVHASSSSTPRVARVSNEERPRPTSTPRASTSRRRTSSSSRTTRQPAAATSAPRSPNPTAPPTVAAAPAPAPATTPSSSPAAGDVTPSPAPGTIADTATETTLPSTDPEPAVDTAATAAPTAIAETAATTTNIVPATPATSTSRSVILPTILILIGLGVLIVLFRASK